jgi:integrase
MKHLKPRWQKHKGVMRWVVDLREWKSGRRFFNSQDAAEKFIAEWKADRQEFGRVAMTVVQRLEYFAALDKLNGVPLTTAVDFYLAHHKAAVESPTLDYATGAFLDAKEASGKRPRYLQQLKVATDSFARFFGPERKCSEVTTGDIERWLAAKGWKPATRRGYRIDARTFFAFCVKRGWCKANPCDGLEPITLDDKPPGILTVRQVEKLMAAAREHDKGLTPYFALGIFAGIRPAEILRLDWSDIDLERGFVEIKSHKSKTRQRRIVELQPNLKAWLALGGDLPIRNWRKRVPAVIRKSGITWTHDCMRHSFGSYHLAAFGSADKTATQMGHRSTQMLFSHYRELVKPDEAKAFWALMP